MIKFEILKKKLRNVYGIPHQCIFTMMNLSIHKRRMVKDNLIPVGLDLDINFKAYPGQIDYKLFFLQSAFKTKLNI